MLSAFGLNTERKSNAVSEHTVADNWLIGLSMYPGGGTNYTRCTCSIRLICCRTRSYGSTRLICCRAHPLHPLLRQHPPQQ